MKITKVALDSKLAELGYKISEEDSFNYVNKGNPPQVWNARSCYIVEADTNIGFANIYARRDGNFKALQELRGQEFIINNRVYEL